MAGRDGNKPLKILRLRSLPGGECFLGRHADIHSEAERAVQKGSLSVADGGGVGVRRAGGDKGQGETATPRISTRSRGTARIAGFARIQ